MHIGRQTLYKWKNAQTENSNLHNIEGENYTEMHTPPNNDAISMVHENSSMSEIEKKLQSELEDMQRQNNTADETIDYLVSENRQLRQRCERYLKPFLYWCSNIQMTSDNVLILAEEMQEGVDQR